MQRAGRLDPAHEAHANVVDRRTIVFTATIYAAILAVGFVAAEAYLRLIGARSFRRTSPGEYPNLPERAWWAQPDAHLGWTAVRSGEDTNAQGFRDEKDFADVPLDGSAQRVMILGDSFMFGAGGPREASPPHLLSQRLRGTHQVFNLAAPGWGIDQMYLAYGRYEDVLKPHVVIVAFIDDDVNRVLQAYRRDDGLNKPSFTLHDGKLRLRTAEDATSRLLNGVMRRSRLLGLLVHETYLTLVARPIVLAMLAEMARDCRAEGRRLVVVRIPLREQSSLSGRLVWRWRDWRTAVRDVGAEYLDPLGEFRRIPVWATDFYIEDGHLSPAGNEQLASIIYDHVFHDTMPAAAR
jgi:hypothetical protein